MEDLFSRRFRSVCFVENGGKIQIVSFFWKTCIFLNLGRLFVILVKLKSEDSKIGFRQERLIQRPF